MKLTRQQNCVINCLQNGWVLITDSEHKGALVASKTHQYRIGSRLFWNLVDKDLIYQGGSRDHHDYILTRLGATIKTKNVEL